MNELALFTGTGGGLLGSEILGWKTICAVEIYPYCREILLKRQRDGVLPMFPIWDDIRSFDGRPWHGKMDIITGGFPCQPFSLVGKRKGKDDERNMWPETIRIIREVRPRLAFMENVPGLLSSGYFDRILSDLAESGYNARWCVLGASDIGANHRRKRLWILAWDSNGRNRNEGEVEKVAQRQDSKPPGVCPDMANTNSSGFSKSRAVGSNTGFASTEPYRNTGSWWSTEPDVGRVVDGVAFRVDRLKAIGNGQLPLCMAYAYEKLFAGLDE